MVHIKFQKSTECQFALVGFSIQDVSEPEVALALDMTFSHLSCVAYTSIILKILATILVYAEHSTIFYLG